MGGTIAQHFILKIEAKALGAYPITKETATILLAISAAAVIIGYIYNQIMDELDTNDKTEREEGQEN